MPSSKLEAVAHEELDIWTYLSHSFTERDLLQLQVYGYSFTLCISRDVSAGDGCEHYFQVAESISPLSYSTHSRTLDLLPTETEVRLEQMRDRLAAESID